MPAVQLQPLMELAVFPLTMRSCPTLSDIWTCPLWLCHPGLWYFLVWRDTNQGNITVSRFGKAGNVAVDGNIAGARRPGPFLIGERQFYCVTCYTQTGWRNGKC